MPLKSLISRDMFQPAQVSAEEILQQDAEKTEDDQEDTPGEETV